MTGQCINKNKVNLRCSFCFSKQREIDDLKEEIVSLKAKLQYKETSLTEGYFGSSTPSSKKPFKLNSPTEKKQRGCKKGHKGFGRSTHDSDSIDEIIDIDCSNEYCPDCGCLLEVKSYTTRSVIESTPTKPEKKIFRVQKKYCKSCKTSFSAPVPSVLPKSLYGNQFITNTMTMHYLHGIPLGRISELTGVSDSSIITTFTRVSDYFKEAENFLINEYRNSPVRHADETGWRVDGQNSYTWLFSTTGLSYFCFGENRSARTPKKVFGEDKLPGVLVVDRYASYNQVPCDIQYCYAHLIRDIEDLHKKHPDNKEIEEFVASIIPLMADAIKLRMKPITDSKYYTQAAKIKEKILKIINSPAKHSGIITIQQLFIDKENRLFHWVESRNIPAENNSAERDLRPTVIARKVSFGSISKSAAKVRGLMTSIFHTLKKRIRDPDKRFKEILDEIADNPKLPPKLIVEKLFAQE